MRKIALLITAGVLALGGLASVSASAAVAGPLDGETLTGALSSSCMDNGDGTSSTGRRADRTNGVATGPVPGTYDGDGRATWENTTGAVTALSESFHIFDALGNDYPVDVTLGTGQGVASCTASSYSLTVTDATYTSYDPVTGALSGTGVVSLSETYDFVAGVGTFTANFGPQLPTTQDQCKNGGWATYPGFKNQGDCVSYVATKGKNKPAGS